MTVFKWTRLFGIFTLFLHSVTISQRTHVSLRNFTEVEISGLFDGDDSDWEGSNTEEPDVEDISDESFDYVPLVDKSMHSDEPLAEYVRPLSFGRRGRPSSGVSASRGHRVCKHSLMDHRARWIYSPVSSQRSCSKQLRTTRIGK